MPANKAIPGAAIVSGNALHFYPQITQIRAGFFLICDNLCNLRIKTEFKKN